MSNISLVKIITITSLGALGSLIANAFGGWDKSLITLLIFMCVDYITGIIVAVMNKSLKTASGGLNSAIGFKGIAKKCMILLYVLIAVRLDLLIETNYIRDAVCLVFILNELLSITENAGIIGVPLPSPIKKVIDVLRKKEEEDNA